MQETINFLSVIDDRLRKSHHERRQAQQYMSIRQKVQIKRNTRFPYAKAINFRESMYKQYPRWLTQKDGFSDFMYKSYQKKLMSIPKICQKEQRASQQKYFLSLYLQQITMFQNLPNQVNQIVLDNMKTKYYKAGEKIYEEGDTNQFIGIVYVGSVEYKVSKRSVIKQKNQVFLHQAFRNKRHPTIVCKQEAIVLSLDHNLSTLINSTLKSQMQIKQRDQILDILKSPFFSELHLQDKKAKTFYEGLKLKFYFQNETIEEAGSQNKIFYMLYKGKIQEENHIYVREHNKWPLPNNCWEVRAVYNSYNKNRFLKKFDFFGDEEIVDNVRFRSKYIAHTWCIIYEMPSQLFMSILNQQDLRRLKKFKAENTDVSYYDFEAKVRQRTKSTTDRKKIVLKAINTSLVHKTEFSPKKMELIKNYEHSMLKKPIFFEENHTISH